MSWRNSLPAALRKSVAETIAEYPKTEPVFDQLHAHLSGKAEKAPKKRKVDVPQAQKNPEPVPAAAPNGPTVITPLSHHNLSITSAISGNEIIFQLPNLSFSSPTRRKLHLVFHLYLANNTPLPVLSVVNPTTNLPEISITNLQSAVRLCATLPILGNSTVPAKKDTVMLCFWLHDEACLGGKNEPIICSLNLDSVKKQLVQDGKISPDAEKSIPAAEPSSEAIKPINELIIDFLQRQFQLCGVTLTNFVPSANTGKNLLTMNDDNAVCVSKNGNTQNDFVMVNAYKGSKEGALLLMECKTGQAYLVFGFKKPILLIDFTKIRNASYKDITRFTFSLIVTVANGDKEEMLEFSMVDQKAFQALDTFIKRMNIDDNSFDEIHREKRAEPKEAVAEETAEAGASDDEEEDGTYTGAVEEDESDSDVDDEFDSNVESSGTDDDDGLESGDENGEEESGNEEVKMEE